ncbi:MAG: sulfur carrier protein ThiS [Desulfobacteraceae bacterium]|nr:sulfur carrier protein ThiS [Desulfobacteraceae bacterium]
MKISLNGKAVQTQSETLLALIAQKGLDHNSLVVEYNFEVIKQDLWADTRIKEGDNIELLSFVGGG